MSEPPSNSADQRAPDPWGGPTRWSLILQAADTSPASVAARDRAWRELIERYREPVRLLLRRVLHGDSQCEDATEGFFSYLFERRVLHKANPELGRFRCYAQGIAKRFASVWLREANPGAAVELDEWVAIEEDATDAVAEADEASWAAGVLMLAIESLRADHPRDAEILVRSNGLFGREPASRESLCVEFGLTLNALAVASNRARERLRECIEEEVRETVVTRADFEAELRMIIDRLLAAHPGLLDDESG